MHRQPAVLLNAKLRESDEAGPFDNPSGPAFRFAIQALAQPCAFAARCVVAGNFSSSLASRVGRRINVPPQFGHTPFNTRVAQSSQNVHSNEQIVACADDGGKSRSQHSQLGLISSMSPHMLLASTNMSTRRSQAWRSSSSNRSNNGLSRSSTPCTTPFLIKGTTSSEFDAESQAM